MLKKLSLAALIAMGSMSVASATPLTDAIKGVTLNGYLRLRFYYDKFDNNAAGAAENNFNRWRTNAKLVFGVPVADGMKFVVRMHAQQNVYENASSLNTANASTYPGTFQDSLFFLNYAKDNVIVNAGVVPLGALPFASSDSWSTAHGPGLVAMYNAGNGVTLAAGWVDKLVNSNIIVGDYQNDTGLTNIDNDVYTVGAIASCDYGKGQLWWYKATNAVKNAFVLMTDLKVLKDYGVGVKFDYAQGKLSDNILANADTHRFYNIALDANVAGFDGIIGFAKTNDKAGIVQTSPDSKLGHITAALRYNVANMTDVKAWYVKAGYNIDSQTNVYVQYANINQGQTAGNVDSDEYDVGGSYKVNKKLTFSAYYAKLNYSNSAETAVSNPTAVALLGAAPQTNNRDWSEFRFQAIYKF